MPGGIAVLHADFPSAHDHNQLLLWPGADEEAVTAAEVVATADRVLGGAGLPHRRVHVQDIALADRLAVGLLAAGYARENELLMWSVVPGPPANGSSPTVVALTLQERIEAGTTAWAVEQPGWPATVTGQLGGRIRTAVPVVDATFLAVRDGARVVARADLFVRDGLAQVEEVGTEPAARGRGMAGSLVRDAVRRAAGAGARWAFLVADADDWPAELYRRLGFVDLGRTASFAR